MTRFNADCCYNILKKIACGTAYLSLLICVLFFMYVITTTFIMQPPTSWTSLTGLPGIGALYYPALFMYAHIISGCIIMSAGLLQIFPIFRKPLLLPIHRILGQIICTFSVSTAVFGNLYIFTSGTVGGINMDIAFSIAGIVLMSFAIVTYVCARCHMLKAHREWALRTWAQIYASLFYRVCYFVLAIFDYTVTSAEDFTRPLDEFLDWFFFLFPMLCMELYIQFNRHVTYKCIQRTFSRSNDDYTLFYADSADAGMDVFNK